MNAFDSREHRTAGRVAWICRATTWAGSAGGVLGIVGSLLMSAVLAGEAAAHGGAYKGPGDKTGTSGAAPVTNPLGADASVKGRSTSSASGPKRSTASTRGAADRSSGRAARGTNSVDSAIIEGRERWEFWWENNKDEYLDLKGHLARSVRAPGGVADLTSRGPAAAAPASRPSITEIHGEVVPFLMNVLDSEEQRDIIDSTVLALGRITRASGKARVGESIRPRLAADQLSVSSSATLALGVLDDGDAQELLRSLMNDDADGRAAVGDEHVHWLVRAFAAISLGLIDDVASVESLMHIVDSSPESERDLRACAIIALGLMDNAERDRIAEFLAGILGDRHVDAAVRSYVPTSLGKLGVSTVVPALLDVLTDERDEHVVRQSAAIGLGRLARMGDAAAIEALVHTVNGGGDLLTRHFAFMSLARIGAADPDPGAHEDMHELILGTLVAQVEAPARRSNRSWAALAAGIYGRAHGEAVADVVAAVREAYGAERDPSYKSAFAVALGLLGDRAMAQRIHDDLMASHDQDFQGYACIALGLLDYVPAAPTLRALCRDETITPTLRLQTATALGLVSDPEAVDVLVETLRSAESLGVTAAVAQALGLIGDVDSIAPLQTVARDERLPALSRAFACVALGLVGERTRYPWNTPIATDNNYAANLPSVAEILDIL